MKCWEPAIELSKKEQFIIKRLKRTRKLFAFLRLHRHELFDDKFQQELEGMYRDTGAGTSRYHPRCCAWRCCSKATTASPTRRRWS